MFRKLFSIFLMLVSSASIGSSVCDFNELSQHLNKIYNHFTDTADKIDSFDPPEICFRRLMQINANYDQTFYYFGIEKSFSGGSRELNKLLENFSAYMQTEDCPGKKELQPVVSDAQNFYDLVKQCAHTT